MNAVKVDEDHRIKIAGLKPGDYYEPEIHGQHAEEITLRRLEAPRRRMTRAEVLKAIDESPLEFTKSWDEIRKETREL
jgi:hypothetical protein